MRINDGSICSNCKYFDHECDDEGCKEYCSHCDKQIHEVFVDDYDYENIITDCPGFEKL